MSNAMMVIFPYRIEKSWVFDDAAKGLVREPFVFGIDDMIDKAVVAIPGAENGFKLIFSAKPFPGFQVSLSWLREEYEGNWYRWEQFGLEGWLCPALLKYFDAPPAEIFLRIDAK